MIYVTLPANHTGRNLTFYLAAEEYIARHMPDGEYFFMWQVTPTVIFGRNQLIQNEVNTDYCLRHGIKMFRRKSGGGCVYADMNNIMFSYITRDNNPVNVTFGKYIDMVVTMLRSLDIPAESSGRNDIMIGGRKVSGNAFYHTSGHSIVHGTMLFDTNMQNMVGAITPSDKKLVSKGIQSVRQHITLLKDYTNLNINEFKAFVKKTLCEREIHIDDDSLEKISQIEKEYLADDFIYGKNPRYNITRSARIENVGDFRIDIEMKNGIIQNLDIKGDFFILADINENIIKPLRGASLTEADITKALPDRLDETIMDLKKKDFVRILTMP